MSKFLYGVSLQWRLDIRNKGVILTYYIVPLAFFVFMGGIFTSIDPLAKKTLIQSMTVFAVTMGALLGSPMPLVALYGTDINKAYKVGRIPINMAIINNIISGFIHLFIVSLIIFFTSQILFKAEVPNNLFLYFIVLSIFIFACLLVGTVLGLFVKSMSKLTMASQFLFLPSIILSGIMFSSNMLPKSFVYLSKILPATWGYINLNKYKFSDLIMLPLIIIIITTTVIIVFKAKYLEETS